MKFIKRESQSQTNDKFLKLKSGDTVKGVFQGEIYEYWVKWENGKSQIVREGTDGSKIRFRVNVVVPAPTGAMVAKIFEFGRPVYDQMEMLNSAYGDITQLKVAIARKGEKLETTYMILPLPNETLARPVMERIKATPLNVLNPQAPKHSEPPPPDFQDMPPEPEGGESFQMEDELPF